jgi:hypothetical protein
MTQATVVKGHRYFYNPGNTAVYPWSPELMHVNGLLPFVAPEDGQFHMGMTLAQVQESAEEAQAKAEAEAKAESEAREAAAAEKAKADTGQRVFPVAPPAVSTLEPVDYFGE